MNIDRALCLFLLILIAGEASLADRELISILRPASGAVDGAEQLLEGAVEAGPAKRLVITVEPFLTTEGRQASRHNVAIREGHFRQKLLLPPGLSIVKATTLGERHLTARVLYLAGQQKLGVPPQKEWGSVSPLRIDAPQGLKVTSSTVSFSGKTDDLSIEAVEVVILDTLDFFSRESDSHESRKIGYHYLPVSKGKFSGEVQLQPGLNILLAKVRGREAREADILVKNLIYEVSPAELSLEDPYVEKGFLVINGKLEGKETQPVKLRVECLVEREVNPGKIVPGTILNRELALDEDGSFHLKVPLSALRYKIKSPPTITLSAGNVVATKTLLDWH